MTRKELNLLMRKYCIVNSELDDVFGFVESLLHMRQNEIVRNEPYAYRTINDLDKAAGEVADLISYVEDIVED